jgi:hypothetical protein
MRRVIVCCLCLMISGCVSSGVKEVDLSGQWDFSLDRNNAGIKEQWYLSKLPEKINLPGSLQEQGYGDKPSADTQWTSGIGVKLLSDPRFTEYINSDDFKCPFWLTPDRHYVGKAWYQREVKIPESWQGKRIVLQLERPHWKTTVWVDDNRAGSCDSLGALHEYNLSDFLKAGKIHTLTVCVDNGYVIPVGKDAHSISDQTQSNWNGITGKICLAAESKVWIEDAQVFPDLSNKRIRVNIQLGNSTGQPFKGILSASAESYNTLKQHKVPTKKFPINWNGQDGKLSIEYEMGDDCLFWDEYQSALYNLSLMIKGKGVKSVKHVQFGMRELGIRDKQFTVNGRKIFLRGTLECCIFPMHGYPPTDVEQWKRIIRIAKAHGLNHFRFHSWCPPEAAFSAADEEGFYLQVAGSCWAAFGNGTALDKWIYEEIDRMIRAYGNHPSFLFFSPSNEPSGRNREQFLGQLLKTLKEQDNRRLYVAGAGWPQIKENQYSIEHAVRLQRWKTLKFDQPPQTYDDYREHVNARPVPVVGHEIGQWCAYPDLSEAEQYTGVLKAKNIEIFRDKLQKAGMGHLAHKFLMASGKLQTLLYKQEVEAALRTPHFAGFQLLDLHDFPGQGTAPVGVLNALWHSKCYVSPEQYRRFCNDVVPLARMKMRVFTNDCNFEAVIDVANYSAADLSDVELDWKIKKDDGTPVKMGKFNLVDVPTGGLTRAGKVVYDLSDIREAARLNLEIEFVGLPYANDWDFWVFPAKLPTVETNDVFIATDVNEQVVMKLNSGTKVLLLSSSAANQDTLGSFQPIFWNRITFPKKKVHTVGILCDPNHPAMAGFPTDYYASWQWQDLLDNSKPLVLDNLSVKIEPIIQPIDDWNNCRRLGLLFEASVGVGKLLVCSIDIQNDLENRVTARQLHHSLLTYMASDQFNPQMKLSLDDIKSFFPVKESSLTEDSRILRIKAMAKPPKILEGHLRMGTPTNTKDDLYGVNSLYFKHNGKPWLPVMGEIHYARVPHEFWEDSILAMKAGGIDIISTYVFWIFHEELQGRYNWRGDCDLRRFVELCKKHNMPVWLRIGPWCHGEARNGGFPDWLSEVCKPRSMDPAYFEQVRCWYTAVAEQIVSLYHKDGGPIIGIQFDNEFGHVGGSGGEPYILKCKEIARELGMDVPYYSVTGWGWAWVPEDEVLPVQGAYVDPFWARGTDQLPPFKELLFSDLESLIVNSDVGSNMLAERIKKERLRYDPSRYPFTMAELGGGMNHTWSRRPVLDSRDTEALALCRVGEGANMIGYYMFHGGSQPLGKTGRLGESSATGMLATPVVSYDYQAPLQEYGKTNDSYYALKRLHFFLHDFGCELAQMLPSLPDDRPEANDPSKLRYALRSKGKEGFLFFNNHQRYLDMPDRENVQFAMTLPEKELVFPAEPITIPSESLGIFPINIPIADARLVYASTQPMMRWEDDDAIHLVMVSLTGIENQLCFTGIEKPVVSGGQVRREGDHWLIIPPSIGILRLTTGKGTKIEILLISELDSLNSWSIDIEDRRYLVICPVELWQSDESMTLRTCRSEPVQLCIYPKTDKVLMFEGKRVIPEKRNVFSVYNLPSSSLPKITVKTQADAMLPQAARDYPFEPSGTPNAWRIGISDIDWDSVSDVFLRFEYIGDTARLYLNGLLVADNLWSGQVWEVGLKHWQKELADPNAELIFVVSPWKKDQNVFVQKRPQVTEDLTAELLGVIAFAEQTSELVIQ